MIKKKMSWSGPRLRVISNVDDLRRYKLSHVEHHRTPTGYQFKLTPQLNLITQIAKAVKHPDQQAFVLKLPGEGFKPTCFPFDLTFKPFMEMTTLGVWNWFNQKGRLKRYFKKFPPLPQGDVGVSQIIGPNTPDLRWNIISRFHHESGEKVPAASRIIILANAYGPLHNTDVLNVGRLQLFNVQKYREQLSEDFNYDNYIRQAVTPVLNSPNPERWDQRIAKLAFTLPRTHKDDVFLTFVNDKLWHRGVGELRNGASRDVASFVIGERGSVKGERPLPYTPPADNASKSG